MRSSKESEYVYTQELLFPTNINKHQQTSTFGVQFQLYSSIRWLGNSKQHLGSLLNGDSFVGKICIPLAVTIAPYIGQPFPIATSSIYHDISTISPNMKLELGQHQLRFQVSRLQVAAIAIGHHLPGFPGFQAMAPLSFQHLLLHQIAAHRLRLGLGSWTSSHRGDAIQLNHDVADLTRLPGRISMGNLMRISGQTISDYRILWGSLCAGLCNDYDSSTS